MKYFFSILLTLLCFQSSLFADAYVKSKMMGGMGTSEMWTGGKKQRTVVNVPGMESMGGSTIKIVRPDKGVEWNISPTLKSYDEKPIAISYKSSEENTTAEEQKEIDQFMNSMDKAENMQDQASGCKSAKLPQEKTIAGMKAVGYQGICPVEGGGSTSTTFWMAAPSEKKAIQIQKEISQFEEANVDAMYAQYPPKEREQTKKIMKLFGTAMAKGLMGIPNIKDLPETLALGMEGSMLGGGSQGMMMEVLQADMVPNDASLYEIPAGYAKVEDVQQLQAQHMMDSMTNGNMKMSDLMNSMGQMAKNMGMQDDTSLDQNSQEVQQADEAFHQSAQFVKQQQQLQGVVPPQATQKGLNDPSLSSLQQAASKNPPEAWQQGLYDQSQRPLNSASQLNPQAYPQANIPPANTQMRYPQNAQPQGYGSPNPNGTQQTLQQVQGILNSVQGIASQLGGNGLGNLGQLGQLGQGNDYAGDSFQEEGSYEDYANGGYDEESSEDTSDSEPSPEEAQEAYQTMGRYLRQQQNSGY